MRKALLFSVPVLLLFFTAVALADDAENAAIIEVVDRAYVQGVHLDSDPDKIRSGMHEAFIMFVLSDKGVTQLMRDAWIERITSSKAKAGDAPRPTTKADIKVLDRAGNAAVVKVDLFHDGKQIFTDYISVYRMSDGWKLVGKVYHRH
jgi:hypothetical protein